MKEEVIKYFTSLQAGDIENGKLKRGGWKPFEWSTKSQDGEDWMDIGMYIESYTLYMYYSNIFMAETVKKKYDKKTTIWRQKKWEAQPHHEIMRRCVFR
jgi:hypothetical protein